MPAAPQNTSIHRTRACKYTSESGREASSPTPYQRMSQNQGMAASPDLVTVYRSMDATAKDDCDSIIEMLSDEHISAVMVDDSAPGVPEGTYEVRVPARDAAKAEKLIDENPLPDEVEEVDNSSGLNLETVFHAEGSGSLAEMQAMNVKNLLESNGIGAVLVGDS